MKKLLLTGGLVLGLGLSCIAQNDMILKHNSKQIFDATKKAEVLKEAKLAQTRNNNSEDKKTSLKPLIRWYDLYKIGYTHLPTNVVSFDTATKTVAFTTLGPRTEEGDEYGRLIYNYSTDNGATWNEKFTDAYQPYYKSDNKPDAAAQFPLGFLINQSNSNDPKDLYYSYYTSSAYAIENPNLKDVIYPYGLLPLGQKATKGDSKLDKNDGEKSLVYPFESYKTKDHIYIVENTARLKKQEEGDGIGILPQNKFLLLKGAIENKEISYKKILINAEDIVGQEFGEIKEIIHPRIVFNNDESLGYIVFSLILQEIFH